MDFFDCNAQVGRYGAPDRLSFFTGNELVENMRRCGIARALAYHSLAKEWHPAKGNEAVFQEIAGLPIEPAWVAMPHQGGDMPEPREFVEEMRRRDVRAVRIFPALHNWRMAEWCAGEMFSVFEQAQVPVLLEMSQTNWDEVQAVLAAHPRLKLVLLRTGYRCDRCIYPLLDRYPNLAIETGGYQVNGGIEALARRFGSRVLVFGTAMPFMEPGGAVSQITYAALPDEDKAAIAGGNLRKLLSWK